MQKKLTSTPTRTTSNVNVNFKFILKSSTVQIATIEIMRRASSLNSKNFQELIYLNDLFLIEIIYLCNADIKPCQTTDIFILTIQILDKIVLFNVPSKKIG